MVSGKISRNSQAPVDLLGDVVPVDQPVDRLANCGDMKWIKFAGLGKGRPNRIERQLGTGAVGYLVLDELAKLGFAGKVRDR